MSTRRWRGDAPAVAQVDTLTPGGTIEAGDLFIITIGGKSVTVTASDTSVATVCDDIIAALAALGSTYPEFAEITFTDSTTHVTCTAKTAGVPFTITVDTTESNGDPADDQTFDHATTTASAGPYDWSTAANWSGGAVPVNSDDVYIENSSVDILYGLDQSAVTLTSLNVAANYTGKIGLQKVNSSRYTEYRPDYLAIGATTINIGDGLGNGSGRIKIDNGSVQTTLNVNGMANTAETGLESLLWKGTHASNVVNITRGSVGAAVFSGEVATIATLRVGYKTNQAADSVVRLGSGVTLTTINQSGGQLTIASNATTINKTAGDLTCLAGAFTTINNDGGSLVYKSTGTIGTLNVSDGGSADFTQDMRARTITNCNLYGGCKFDDSFKTIVFTNPFQIVRAGLEDIDLKIGQHIALQRS